MIAISLQKTWFEPSCTLMRGAYPECGVLILLKHMSINFFWLNR